MARDIDDALSDIRRPEAPICFEELSWFGGDKPRAIVAKVKPEPALMDLQAEQERRLGASELNRRRANIHRT